MAMWVMFQKKQHGKRRVLLTPCDLQNDQQEVGKKEEALSKKTRLSTKRTVLWIFRDTIIGLN